MSVGIITYNPAVNSILSRARKSSRKGSYQEYEYFKCTINDLHLGHLEYNEAIKELATILRV